MVRVTSNSGFSPSQARGSSRGYHEYQFHELLAASLCLVEALMLMIRAAHYGWSLHNNYGYDCAGRGI